MLQNEATTKTRVDFKPMSLAEGETVRVEIRSAKPASFTKRNGNIIPFILVRNLDTKADCALWLTGRSKFQFEMLLEQKGTLAGTRVEMINKGKVPLDLDGEEVEITDVEIYELQ